MNEIWQDILGYEGIYQVSNEGQVRSLDRMVKHQKGGLQTVKGKILKPSTTPKGYQHVILCKNGKAKNFFVHRLVYAAFCGEIPEGLVVNHINEVKTDNRLENLNLMTQKENINWGTGHERSAKANLNHPQMSKPVVGMDEQGNVVITFPSAMEAGRNGYTQGNISACCRGKVKHHKGLIWKYKDDWDC